MEILRGVSQAMAKARQANTADAFSQLGYDLGRLRGQVRENLQIETSAAMRDIIQKLEKDQPLTEEEKGQVRLWVVGDAEGYVKMEQTLKEWLAEYKRLTGVIEDYAGRPDSLLGLVDLHGILEDVAQVANNVARFLDDQERLKRFDAAINNLSAADGKLIADILRDQLSSPEM
jgi:hypothetical protein